MRKVHVKRDRLLAVALAAVMCLSVPMDRVLADTISPGDAADAATESTLPAGAPEDSGETGVPVAQAAGDEELFSYDGATATEGVLGLTQTPWYGKQGALKFSQGIDINVCKDGEEQWPAITSGTAVFEMELCPASKCNQSVVFKNSKGDTLFAFVIDAPNTSGGTYYLSDAAGSTSGVNLGAYAKNTWSMLRTELYLDESTGGQLKFKVSVAEVNKGGDNTYPSEDNGNVWVPKFAVTQEDLKTANGTVTELIDGSAEHPFDLGSITLAATTNDRYCGDIRLYNKTAINAVELSGELPVQICGTAFNPGDAALVVTDADGGTVTKKLSEMMYDMDYTVSGYTAETPESDSVPITITYEGVKLSATVAVKNVMTGIQIKTQPTKKTYAKGETFDKSGLEVVAVMSGGTTVPLAEDAYTVSSPDMSTTGSKDVTVTYKENEEFTASFRVKVESKDENSNNTVIFSYKGDAASLDELGLAGDTGKVRLSTTPVSGSIGQNLAFADKGTVTKSWDAVNTGIVKINVEFNQENKNNIAHFRLYDKENGNLLINVIQQKSGNVNLYKNTDTGDSYEKLIETQIGKWIRLETEIDLTASNMEQKLIFTMKSFYKDDYTDAEWIPGKVVSNETYEGWGAASGCVSDITEFSLGSLAIQGTGAGVAVSSIEVLVPKSGESQSFKYIDEEDITGLELDAPVGFLEVVTDAKGSNETNKLKINGESTTKTLKTPISTGTVTFETVSYHNGKILGIKILNGEGRALVNYSQQSSGNLNMYKGDAITGGLNTITLASKDSVKNRWIKTVTTIDLDKSNELGVLQFEMNVSYKKNYTDEEWIPVETYTQQETYVGVTSNASANGCATEGITSFEVGGVQFGSQQGEAYVDDILFDDGGGISGIVTITEKVLKSMAITTEATTKEFPQDSKISTEGMVLTGTYDVTYSDGNKEEKTYKITKYDVECDTSKVAESVPVTIKVTDNGQEFTATYNVKITPKPDGSYVTFSYTDESGVAQTGFGGSKIKVSGGDTYGNNSNKIQLDKGDSTMTLADPCTTGTVHFETEFLTTSTSGASLFLRILNSEGKPMVDIAQYGSGNLNLYIDKKTSGTDGDMAGQFKGLPVKQWAKLSVDIDLDRTKEEGHLMFDAIVWTKADYAGDWSIHAEYDQDLYLKSTMAPTTTGSASSDATVLDVASIELVTSNGTSYYDNMFFEAIRGDVAKELTRLWIEKPAEKTEYTVGDSLNRTGLVLKGIYKYSFQNGDVKEREAEITKYDISFDNTQPGDTVPVTLTAGGLSVSYEVLVRPNTALDDIEEYLVKEFINNKLVTLDDWNAIHMNKRQVKLPIETKKGEKLTWSIDSGDAIVSGAILTVNPSKDGGTEVGLKVTLSTTNNDGDPVNFSKTLKVMVPKESGKAADDSFATEESLRYAVKTLYDRNIFQGQAELTDVDTIMGSLDREIRVEEIAAILVNLFNIDTTYADAKISRSDVEDDAWYSKFVKAAFQLSVETRDSREGKQEYGIGKGISKANLLYMIDRIIHIDQTTMPDDYQERMFE